MTPVYSLLSPSASMHVHVLPREVLITDQVVTVELVYIDIVPGCVWIQSTRPSDDLPLPSAALHSGVLGEGLQVLRDACLYHGYQVLCSQHHSDSRS